MGFNQTTPMDTDVLRRLAALLLFMAHLAWRSTGERSSVRADRLFYLGQAEAVVMAFVAGEDREEGHRLAALTTLGRPSDRVEALRLSLSLRLLALIVLNIAAGIDNPPQPLLRIRLGAEAENSGAPGRGRSGTAAVAVLVQSLAGQARGPPA